MSLPNAVIGSIRLSLVEILALLKACSVHIRTTPYEKCNSHPLVYTGFPRFCNNTVQTDLRTRKFASGKFDSSQA